MDDRNRLPRFGRIVVATGLALIGVAPFGIVSAVAAPTGTSVSAYRLPCDSSQCDENRRLDGGDTVDGLVQIQAESSSTIGLRSVELQLQDGGSWTCVERWTTSARSGNWQEDIDFREPVRGCNGSPLTDGRNGAYRLRAVATDGSGSQASPALTVQVASPPLPPVWASEPARDGGETAPPAIVLRWYRNPEPDIVEYHFARSGPDGIDVYAVSADHPGGQGCSLENDIYTCTDDDFPERGYGGRYAYSLRAYRAAPDGSTCSLPGSGTCVGSSSNSPKSLSIEAPAEQGGGNDGSGGDDDPPPPPPGPDDREPGNTTRRPERTGPPSLSEIASGGFQFEGGEYDPNLPYAPADDPFEGFVGDEQAFDPADPTGSFETTTDPRRGFLAIAGGMVLIAAAIQVMRLLRDPEKSSR